MALKQHVFSIWQFWRSEVQNMSYWVKMKVSTGLHSFWRFWGSVVSLLFQLPEASCTSWLLATFTFKASSNACSTLPLTLSLPPPSFILRTHRMTLGPPRQTFQDHLPISRSLIKSAKSLLPCKATYSQLPGLGDGHLWCATVPLPTGSMAYSPPLTCRACGLSL